MRELSVSEEKRSYGGGISASIYAALVAGVSLVVGFFDGLTRPFRCR